MRVKLGACSNMVPFGKAGGVEFISHAFLTAVTFTVPSLARPGIEPGAFRTVTLLIHPTGFKICSEGNIFEL